MDLSPAVKLIRDRIANVQAIYLFGSQARQVAGSASDIDLAVLAKENLEPVARFALQEDLAALFGMDVDLVDLRSASTVFRAEILRGDKLLYTTDGPDRKTFEMYALSDYARLNEERKGILQDIVERGSVHG